MQCSSVGRACLVRSILAGIVVASAAGCGGCPDDTVPAPHPPPPPPPPPAADVTVEMRAKEFEFIPNRISVGPEVTMKIVLTNEGTTRHSFDLELPAGEVELEEALDPGETGEVTFTTPEEMGDYEYYCPIGNHRAMGMVGQLTVERQVPIGLRPVAEGMTSPVAMIFPPEEPGKALIVDQIGVIRVLGAEGELLETPYLDVRDRLVDLDPEFDERGLLGLALHPDYVNNGRVFVYYSAPLQPGAPDDWNHTARISEYALAADSKALDPDSEQILLEVHKPQANHNGGTLVFGPDGYLYISLGDGGGAGDDDLGHAPQGNGQDLTTLLGKILRIDVDGAAPYAIPPDNPFVGVDGLDEIYAYGLRNAYRMSFDRGGDGALYAGDVGQNLWEEVNIIERGGNYGWRIREGTHCFDPESPDVSPLECAEEGAMGEPLIDPIIEYAHDPYGEAVVGGYVYRGAAFPDLEGRYVFADWSREGDRPMGTLLSSPPRSPEFGVWPIQIHRIDQRPDGELGEYVVGFGQDLDGELYLLTKGEEGPIGTTGRVYRLVPAE